MSRETKMKTLIGAILACTACLAVPALAQAGSPIIDYQVSSSSTQAGGHPDLNVFLWTGNRSTEYVPAPSCDCNDPADLHMHLPAGIIGDPHATPRCSSQDFGNFECPTDSQVGAADLHINTELPTTDCFGQGGGCFQSKIAVYNLIPHPGQAGLLAFSTPLLGSPVYEVISPRTESDYGLDVEVIGIEHTFPLAFVTQEMWGVPASEDHFDDRLPIGCEPLFNLGSADCNNTVPSTSPETPFLSNPTTCGVPLTSSVDVRSYDGGFTHADTTYPETDGCDLLSFNPSMFAQPTTTATDSASGLDIDLQAPQTQSPTVPSPSELRANVLTLPPGLTLNASAADGKVACTDVEARFGSRDAAECPENAKIGTLVLTSAALPGPLPGYVYIGEPKPGEKFRIILVADGFSVHIKLVGVARPDPQTGQLTVHFDDLPQAPFSDLNVHLFGSERAVLATATHCDTYTVSSIFTPWDDFLSAQGSSQVFSLDSGPSGAPCPGAARPFTPTFQAGVTNKTGGAHSPFVVNLTRPDGDQTLDVVSVTTPPGFAATIAGVPYCPESAIAQAADPGRSGVAERESPSCPAASQVGTVIAGIGAGSHPFYAQGNVYLAGPYKGGPLSLVTIIPGVSGPYDLGDVVDRIALKVNPTNAQITATSDPIPSIVEGVPLRTRSVLLKLDRPDFALNPTNCNPFQVGATDQRRPGCRGLLLAALPGRKLLGPALRPQDADEDQRRHEAGPASGPADRSHHGPGRIQYLSGHRRAAQVGADRQRPHQPAVHASPVRGECLPGVVADRVRQGRDAAPRRAGGRAGVPAVLVAQASRHRRRPRRPDRCRPGGQDRHDQGPAPAHDLRRRSGHAGDQVRPQSERRVEGPVGQQHQHLPQRLEGHGPLRRPERQVAEDHHFDQSALWQEEGKGKAQRPYASSAGKGGEVSDGEHP